MRISKELTTIEYCYKVIDDALTFLHDIAYLQELPEYDATKPFIVHEYTAKVDSLFMEEMTVTLANKEEWHELFSSRFSSIIEDDSLYLRDSIIEQLKALEKSDFYISFYVHQLDVLEEAVKQRTRQIMGVLANQERIKKDVADEVRAEIEKHAETAIKEGLMQRDGNKYKWQKSKVLLGYFLGKMFRDDYVREEKNYREWVKSSQNMPNGYWECMDELFNMKGIKHSVETAQNPPRGYKKVDSCF